MASIVRSRPLKLAQQFQNLRACCLLTGCFLKKCNMNLTFMTLFFVTTLREFSANSNFNEINMKTILNPLIPSNRHK